MTTLDRSNALLIISKLPYIQKREQIVLSRNALFFPICILVI